MLERTQGQVRGQVAQEELAELCVATISEELPDVEGEAVVELPLELVLELEVDVLDPAVVALSSSDLRIQRIK